MMDEVVELAKADSSPPGFSVFDDQLSSWIWSSCALVFAEGLAIKNRLKVAGRNMMAYVEVSRKCFYVLYLFGHEVNILKSLHMSKCKDGMR